MTETLTTPTPQALRDELLALAVGDLLGPAGGADEIVKEQYVRSRYALGRVAPRGESTTTDEDDQESQAAPNMEDGRNEAPLPSPSRLQPSSIGLTVTVTVQATAIQVEAQFGHYTKVKRGDVGLAGDPDERVWKRTQIRGISEPIPLREGRIAGWTVDSAIPDVFVEGVIRKLDHEWIVTLYLVNGKTAPKKNLDEAYLFQPELSVTAPDGSPIFAKYLRLRDRVRSDPEDEMMRMLYRKEVEFGVGHGVSIHAERDSNRYDRAVKIKTCVVPMYQVPRTTPPTFEEIPELGQVVLDMRALAQLRDDEFAPALMPLADAYAKWIQELRERVASPSADIEPFLVPAQLNIEKCENALRRLQEGIALLGNEPMAGEAFRFANRAMYEQRKHSLYAQAVRQGKEAVIEDFESAESHTWYPFQLAFILLNLPALTNPLDPDRAISADARADLLWYPTGGGKTEAYLGLTAYTLGIRRLQPDYGGLNSHTGVAVLMRYTLRLLTLQQFQRASALICACEVIRRENPAKWGTESFRIGLWVGQRSTPNRTKDAAEVIEELRRSGRRQTTGGTPYQLTNCPWCGSPIRPGHDLIVERLGGDEGRTLTYCGNPIGDACPFTRRTAPGEGLPVIVVDEEIYRRLPALVIATVDKFAQMPHKGAVEMLFGRVDAYCERHGYCSPELDCPATHPKLGALPRVSKQECARLRPPDLIIQDELHLINGPLGTLVGLYEMAVDYLCSWEFEGKRIRPKVIASSATIRQAPRQVQALYLRRAEIFPPSGLDASDNFFARQRDINAEPGRLYIGICAPGERAKAVLISTYVAFLSAAQTLYKKYGASADPWLTLVGYFNAIREMGGTRRAVEDSVRSRLGRMDERGLERRFIWATGIEELTSRKSAGEIPEILDRLETPFDPESEAARKEKVKRGERSPRRSQPLDVLLATNMISVGVDVPRLGLMIVNGQPKYTAEYIQATSRIGRREPGLVSTILNWARPRDLSHYERFEHYHATFYQQVESLTVTPLAAGALRRGLTAVLVSYIRLLGKDFNANESAGAVTREHPFTQTALHEITRRAGEMKQDNETARLVEQELEARIDQWLHLAAQARAGAARLGYKQDDKGHTRALLRDPDLHTWDTFTVLNSLRDVELPINLIMQDYGLDDEPVHTDETE